MAANPSQSPLNRSSSDQPAKGDFRSNSETPNRTVVRIRHLRRRWLRWLVLAVLLLVIAGFFIARYMVGHAAPILRARVIQTLQARYKSKVDLAEIDVSFTNGLAVHGSSLQIFGQTDPNPYEPGVQPLISVQEFRFQTGLLALFHSPMHVNTVYVKGAEINIPPHEERQQIGQMGKASGKIAIVVDELLCENTKLLINTRKPGKAPLTFDIGNLKMHDVGPGNPMPFEATLVNPKPLGNIESKGKFGPFDETVPRKTPVSGEYSFTHADLGTLKGIAGILSSTGKFHGILGKIEAEGETDTPDFRLNSSGHPVNLHTDFHAIVDGTDGDTYLQPVKARFLHSSFTAQGKVIRVQTPHGHDIELSVQMDQGRIEDLLTLGVKTDPPVMNGPAALQMQMSLPPGSEDLANRLKLDGNFKISGGEFSNEKIQTRINDLSLRAQGRPQMLKQLGNENVPSVLNGTFRLNDGVFTFSQLQFSVPGVHSAVTGQYSLDGNVFDFHGKLRMDAKLSQTITGWKSVLLKPVDPFLSKNGAGTEIPFKVTGTRSAPRFGLDFGHGKSAQEKQGAPTAASH